MYYADELQYYGKYQVGTCIHNINLGDFDAEFADKVNVPIHISSGTGDKVISLSMN